MRSAAEIAADLLDPPEIFSKWYCKREVCDGEPHDSWGRHARTQQHPPTGGDWLIWFVKAGRGGGKSRTAAEWIIDGVLRGEIGRIALVARTPADARDVMIEGPGGILPNSPSDFRPEYMKTSRQLIWPNGAVAHTYSSFEAAQLRGPEHDAFWGDEVSSWEDARKGDVLDTTWNNLLLGLRAGKHPRGILTSTPKPNKLTKEILKRPDCITSTWSTYDNKNNLAPSFRDSILNTYENTRIGRQEILGELLEDVEGALWTQDNIDHNRVEEPDELTKIVVAVDPNGSDDKDADEAGILVVGKGANGHGYVLADRTLVQAGPSVWAKRAVAAYLEFGANKIVAEGNYGGAMVKETIRMVDPHVPVEIVHASSGKRQRAEPVSALYEQDRVHHVGALLTLEDELTTWTGTDSGWSPGRLDALVWGIAGLKLIAGSSTDAFLEAAKRRAARTPEEDAAARKEAAERMFSGNRTPRCSRSEGHLWRNGQCMACGLAKETP